MEISGANSSAYSPAYDRSVTVSRVSGSVPSSQGSGDEVYDVTTVQISPEAVSRNSYADDGDTDTDGDGSGTDGDSVDAASDSADTQASDDTDAASAAASDEAAQADDAEAPSASKSFVYGALGLERPEHGGKRPDGYDFGRWVAAGVTVGTIISVLV